MVENQYPLGGWSSMSIRKMILGVRVENGMMTQRSKNDNQRIPPSECRCRIDSETLHATEVQKLQLEESVILSYVIMLQG